MTIRASRLILRNIAGIEERELKLGKWNLIEGGNGTGKTSVLRGLRSFANAPEATLLRKGAEKGEAVLILDDGTEITRTITQTGKRISVNREGKTVEDGAKAYLQSTFDSLTSNPIDFLRCGETPKGKRQRLDWLLEVLPVPVDYTRVSDIVGAKIEPIVGRNGIERIEGLYQEFFAERTSVKRSADEKAATIKQVRDTLPDESELPSADPTDLEAAVDRIRNDLNDKLAGVDAKLKGYRDTNAAEVEALQAQIEEKRQWMRETEAKADTRKAELKEAANAEAAPIREKLAVIRANQDRASKAAGARETIKTMEEQENRLRENVTSLTAALDGLQAYKAELLSTLPIDGLTVNEGDIYRHGVQFDSLNTAQQIDIAVDVAKLRAGELGLICVDGIEALDAEALEAFQAKAMADDNIQLIVTRVSDGDFNFTSEG